MLMLFPIWNARETCHSVYSVLSVVRENDHVHIRPNRLVLQSGEM